jgi:hypothetical protein
MSTTTIQVRLKIQLNSILFAKTLVRKDVASSAPPPPSNIIKPPPEAENDGNAPDKKEGDEFSSKAQIMTLMTTDVDRVSDFAWHVFALVGMYSHTIPISYNTEMISLDSPIEIAIGSLFLYKLLGMRYLIWRNSKKVMTAYST